MLQASRLDSGWRSNTFILHISRRLKEALLIGSIALGLFLIISLTTNSPADPGWSHTGTGEEIQNATGRIGAWISDFLLSWFGIVAYLFATMIIYMGVVTYRGQPVEDTDEEEVHVPWRLWVLRSSGLLLTLLSSCGLASLHFQVDDLPMTAGGYIGAIVSHAFVWNLNVVGSSVLLLAALLMGVTFLTGLSWLAITEWTGATGLYLVRSGYAWASEKIAEGAIQNSYYRCRDWIQGDKLPKILQVTPVTNTALATMHAYQTPIIPKPTPPATASISESGHGEIVPAVIGSTTAPSLGLLESVDNTPLEGAYSAEDLTSISRMVENRLEEFGITAAVVGVLAGPVITRFELDLAPGIKVSKISGLAKDLARALSVVSVRIVEVIPGKPYVGLEIPNVQRELVRLKEILEDDSYQHASSPLTLALGKDISGTPVVADLAKMPHLLVAGTTGSGKSVGVNAMLLSILYKASPEEVRMILIDPKMLELAIYDHIPHLLTPVVTDMKEAANALRWCVEEMEQRYQRMAALGVRHLAGYNRKIAEAAERGEPVRDPLWDSQQDGEAPILSSLPYIVVVIDEFADMMLVVGKKVEDLIARIAQKARAAGIHLILATQRPSVDVITGLIKANIPTRIAFQVSCKIDSRTILDQSGAEQLLGHGDMLYLPPGVGIPTRIHGAFVADEEVHKVVNEWRKQGKPCYIAEIVARGASGSSGSGDEEEEYDPLYDEAVAIVLETRRPSISHLQRRLKVGYNRAARLIEKMEGDGMVSAIQPNGSRDVLVQSAKD